MALARLVNGGSLPPHCAEFCAAAVALTLAVSGFCAWGGVHRSPDGHGGAAGESPVPAPGRVQRGAEAAAQWRGRVAAWLPNPVAFAIGMYVAPSWTVARLVGAGVAAAWEARQRARGVGGGTGVIMVATGLVLGEGLAAFATASLAALRVAPWTCAGCLVAGQCGNACP